LIKLPNLLLNSTGTRLLRTEDFPPFTPFSLVPEFLTRLCSPCPTPGAAIPRFFGCGYAALGVIAVVDLPPRGSVARWDGYVARYIGRG
jgi:hypothetical protein